MQKKINQKRQFGAIYRAYLVLALCAGFLWLAPTINVSEVDTGVDTGRNTVPDPQPAAVFLDSYTSTQNAYDVALAGDVAYVGYLDGHFKSINISDPGDLQLLHTVQLDTDDIRGVAVEGDIAYLARTGAGLTCVNVSEPPNFVTLDTYDTTGNAYDVVVKRNVAYVADGANGLVTIDVSDPTNIQLLDSISTGDFAYGIAVCGNVACVADRYAGLRTINVTDPTNLEYLDDEDTIDEYRNVAIEGEIAYVAAYQYGLWVYNISNPADIQQLDYNFDPDYINDVVVSGDYAFLADYLHGLIVMDVSNPASTNRIDICDTGAAGINIEISGDVVYMTCGYGGLQSYRVFTPVTPERISTAYLGSSGFDIAVYGNVGYLACGAAGFVTADISNPAAVIQLDSYDPGGTARGIAVDGNVAYIGNDLQDAGGEFISFDVSDPRNIQLLDVYHTSNACVSIAISGDIACVADNIAGLLIFNISNPRDLVLLDSFDTGPNYARGVAISGNIAFVGAGSDYFQSFDISDPTNIVYLDNITWYDNPNMGHAADIAIAGDVAFVAQYSDSLVAVNISNPADLQYLDSIPGFESGQVFGVGVSGDLAFTAETSGLVVYNISNPGDITFLYNYTINAGHEAFGIAIAGEFVYVSAWFYSLSMVKIRQLCIPPAPPVLNIIQPNPSINGSICLDWNDVLYATSYLVYRHLYPIDTRNVTVNAELIAWNILTSDYIDQGRPEGIWWYAIVAVNATGDSFPSNTRSAMVKFLPPAPELEEIDPNPDMDGNIVLNWSDVPLADNYTVYRHTTAITDTNLATAMVVDQGIEDSEYVDTGCPENTWWYAIVACNETGNSSVSLSQSVIVDLPGPAQPVLLAIEPNPSSDGNIHLDWNDVLDADSYIVLRYTEAITGDNFDLATVLENDATTSEYTDLNRPDGTWWYAIRARNATGTSDLSNSVSVTVQHPGGGVPGPNWSWILIFVVLGVFVIFRQNRHTKR